MQIPERLQHFAEPTLLVLADHVEGKFFLAGGDAIEVLDGVAAPHDAPRDQEGSFIQPKDDAERIHHLIHLLCDRTNALVEEGKATRVALIMSADLMNGVKAHLEQHVAERIWKEVPHDCMKESISEFLERLFA